VEAWAMMLKALLSGSQLVWLENELKATSKIKLVFMHFPPLVGDDVKPGYFPSGVEAIQQIFSKYEVAGVFSAHVETALHKNIGNVDYYILPGIYKNPVYENVFARIRMIDKKAIVTLIYKNEAGEFISSKIE
jgi:hypothetical protein